MPTIYECVEFPSQEIRDIHYSRIEPIRHSYNFRSCVVNRVRTVELAFAVSSRSTVLLIAGPTADYHVYLDSKVGYIMIAIVVGYASVNEKSYGCLPMSLGEAYPVH